MKIAQFNAVEWKAETKFKVWKPRVFKSIVSALKHTMSSARTNDMHRMFGVCYSICQLIFDLYLDFHFRCLDSEVFASGNPKATIDANT